jgi:hypothetical protein
MRALFLNNMSLESNDRVKKSAFQQILATKTVDLGVKGFHLVREVPFMCFFNLEMAY